MRTLILASEKGSLINFRGDLIRDLVSRGGQVYVAAPQLRKETDEAFRLMEWGAEPLELLHLKRNTIAAVSDIRAFLSIAKMIVETRPDVVIAYTIKPVVYGLLASRLLRVTRRVALITGLGYSFIEPGRRDYRRLLVNRVVRLLYRLSLGGATRVIFQNPDDRAAFLDAGIVPASVPAGLVNGSGVNLDRFRPRELPQRPLMFLMVARILRDKGVTEFISASKRIQAEYRDARFVLAGPFDENPGGMSPAELDELLRDSRVQYVGVVADVRELLAKCHVFVLPSYREGTPRTVLEAMAVGRPIITTNVPGCRETVREGFNGYLVPPQSSAELANSMRRFLDDPSAVEWMGENSLCLVRAKYDVRKVNASLLELLG